MVTNRTRNTFLNVIMMVLNTAVLSILALVSTNIILKNYGSDFNGVVQTANQFVNLLLIVEGGFTTAINVALFKPFVENDEKKINRIMSAAKKTFFKIGSIFLIISIIVSLIYPLFIKSNLEYLTIFLIFVMVMLGTAYNLLFVIRHQIVFQVSQREYVYTFFGVICNTLSSITTIILAYNKVNMLIIRFSVLMFTIINGLIIYILYKKTFKNINTNEEPDYKSIKGTTDIMIQKLTSVVYLSAPLLFISTFISTKMASVYAVYNSIYNIIKNFLSSMVAAPVNGFGQLLNQKKEKEVYPKFKLYEFIVIVTSTILIAALLIMIIPFIKIYTADVKDINYVNFSIAVLMAVITYLEIIHVPAGNIINVTGHFKVARKIQTIASVILVSLLFIGGVFFKIYGILLATLITNIILAYMEIAYVHKNIFNKDLKDFFLKFSINVLMIIILVCCFKFINLPVANFLMFFIIGFGVFMACAIIILLINYLIFKDEIKDIIKLVKKFLLKG